MSSQVQDELRKHHAEMVTKKYKLDESTYFVYTFSQEIANTTHTWYICWHPPTPQQGWKEASSR